MKWTREIGQKIGKLYLTNEKMTEGLKQAILEVAPEFPEKYFEAWFREAHLSQYKCRTWNRLLLRFFRYSKRTKL